MAFTRSVKGGRTYSIDRDERTRPKLRAFVDSLPLSEKPVVLKHVRREVSSLLNDFEELLGRTGKLTPIDAILPDIPKMLRERLKNRLLYMGVHFTEQLEGKSYNDILKTKGIGRKSMNALIDAVHKNGFYLGGERPRPTQ